MKNTDNKLPRSLAGPNQEQYNVARKMLSRRFPASSICRITQLSNAEVETLQQEVNAGAIAQEALDQLQAQQRNHHREIHLLATKRIDEQQAQQQAPWLFEDDWYLGYREQQQRLGAFIAEA
ncbi:MAG: hypothetical protein HC860_11815 [Alkalinema sp. RU_4_3]|nr:hypothetical protein [Alkalinema sp. RU_4_3]